jgi:hypothetical protein
VLEIVATGERRTVLSLADLGEMLVTAAVPRPRSAAAEPDVDAG